MSGVIEPPPSVYLDTNAFIDFIDGIEELALGASQLMLRLRSNRGSGVTSELTLAEVLAPSRGSGTKRRLFLDLIVFSGIFRLEPVTRSILYRTVDIRRGQRSRLKLPDAIHLATASAAGCSFFVSRDSDLRRLPRGMAAVSTYSGTAWNRLMERLP